MKKLIIAGQINFSLIEEIGRAVEEKTGEKVVVVCVKKEEVDFFNQTIPIVPIPIIPIEATVITKPKRKGHERPYKYHK